MIDDDDMADADANERHALGDRSTVVSPDGLWRATADSDQFGHVDRSSGDDTHGLNSSDMMQAPPAPTTSGSVAAALDRSTYIGSADAAAVADLSPWGSPLSVWNRLVGLTIADEDEKPLRFYLGKRLEPIILDLYEMRVGHRPDRVIDDDAPPMRSTEYPFIGAHPDYERLEIKTARSGREWGEDGEIVTLENMAIPLHYYLQVQHQLFVTGWTESDIAVLIGHDEFRAFTVPRNPVIVAALVRAEVELWTWAQEGIVPPQSDTASRSAYLRKRFPIESEPPIPPTPEDELIVAQWRRAQIELAHATEAEDRAAFAVKARIGSATGLSGVASYKSQTRRALDTTILTAELKAIGREDIIERSMRSTTFRVLRSIGRKKEDDGADTLAPSAGHDGPAGLVR